MTTSTPVIVMRGAGDLATGAALRLFRAGFHKLVLLETPNPLAVRRTVAFSEAVRLGKTTVEDVTARLVDSPEQVVEPWIDGEIPVLVDPEGASISRLMPEILVDAIIAKRNIGTNISQAPLVIGLGPGFTAGEDVHRVIETKRGHHLGRVIENGSAAPNTGIPGNIGGHTIKRVYWAKNKGIFHTPRDIGDMISEGETLGTVDDTPVIAALSGVIRGLLRDNTPVGIRTKLGDVDPRGTLSYCGEVSDKALSVGGGILEAITAHLFSRKAA